jgi:hypothetical protein
MDIDDESHVDEPRPRRDVSEIRHPKFIRPSGSELAYDQVYRISRLGAADGGAAFAATHRSLQSERSHQSFDRTTGDRDAIPAELPPYLAGAVDLEVFIIGAPDLFRKFGIAPQARRRQVSR